MKNFVVMLSVIALSFYSKGQVSEGKVKYNVSITSEDASIASQLSMLSGTYMEYHFAENLGRVDLALGVVSTTTTIFDLNNKVSTTLITSMQGNEAYTSSFDEKEKDKALYVETEKTDEVKKVKGYTCKKYILVDEEGNSFIVWATTDIKAMKERIYFFQGDYEGFPLEFECAQGPLKFKFTATEVADTLKKINKKEYFSTAIPKGYKVVSKEEIEGSDDK